MFWPTHGRCLCHIGRGGVFDAIVVTMIGVNTYSGLATLVLKDGTRAAVAVSLRSFEQTEDSPGEWSGALHTTDGSNLFDSIGDTLTIEMPSGAISSVVVAGFDITVGRDAVEQCEVAGVGPAPF